MRRRFTRAAPRVLAVIAVLIVAAGSLRVDAFAAPSDIFTTATTVETPAGTQSDYEEISLIDEEGGHAQLVLKSGSKPVVKMTVRLAQDGQIDVPFVDDGIDCCNMAASFSFWRRTHRDGEQRFEVDLSPNENGLAVAVPMTIVLSRAGGTPEPLSVQGEAYGNYSVDGTSTITHNMLRGNIEFAQDVVQRATFQTLLFFGAPLARLARSYACTLERGFVHDRPLRA